MHRRQFLFGSTALAITSLGGTMRVGPINELNLACMGDSMTAARIGGASMIQTYPVLISKQRGYGNVVNAGIAAETTTNMVARYSADVLAHRAGAVSIMGGANDMTSNMAGTYPNQTWAGAGISKATSKANLKSMVQSAQALRARVTLVSPVPVFRAVYLANFGYFYDAMMEVVSETGCEFMDVYTRIVSLPEEYRNSLLIDDHHPNAAGHAYIAGMAAEPGNALAFSQF